GSTGGARRDRGGDLDERHTYQGSLGRYQPVAERALEPHRVAHHVDAIPHLQGLVVADAQVWEIRCRNPEDREIATLVVSDEEDAVVDLTGGELHLQRSRVLDDVAVRYDLAVGGDEEAGALADHLATGHALDEHAGGACTRGNVTGAERLRLDARWQDGEAQGKENYTAS